MTDCLIVGGGLIGLLTARELHKAGMEVTLLERGLTGTESSWAGGGILSPLYPWRYSDAVTDLASWSQRYYPTLAKELEEESGIDPEYIKSGHLILDTDEMADALQWASRTHASLTQLDKSQLYAFEPELAPHHHSALCMPEVGQIRNPRLLKAIRAAVEKKITLLENTEVTDILVDKQKVIGVKASGRTFLADNTLICAGAWTQKVLSKLSCPPNIEPVHGQMILFRAKPGVVSRIVLHKDRYIIPRQDGRILVGSTLEFNQFDKRTTPETRQELHARAIELMPALANFPIEKHWAGLRPGSPNGVPYIGEHVELDGLFINSGHFRNGVVLGPASCRLTTDIILGLTPILSCVNYKLDSPRQ